MHTMIWRVKRKEELGCPSVPSNTSSGANIPYYSSQCSSVSEVLPCVQVQHMGLWGDVQHTCYYRKWSSQAHSNTVLLSPCVLSATWDLSKCSFHLCSSGTLWYLLFPASIHSATQTQQPSWWVLNTGLQSLLAGDPWTGYLTGCHLTFSWVMTAT